MSQVAAACCTPRAAASKMDLVYIIITVYQISSSECGYSNDRMQMQQYKRVTVWPNGV